MERQAVAVIGQKEPAPAKVRMGGDGLEPPTLCV